MRTGCGEKAQVETSLSPRLGALYIGLLKPHFCADDEMGSAEAMVGKGSELVIPRRAPTERPHESTASSNHRRRSNVSSDFETVCF